MAETTNTQETPELRVAVITGASSGIGQATALAFAAQGYSVVLVARREQALREIGQLCEEAGGHAIGVVADITNEAAVTTIADAAVSTFGQIDVWVNGAGVYMVGKFDDLPSQAMHRLMDVNFFGCVNGSQVALKQFKTQEYGTLINISSFNAAAPQPYTSVYTASKYAIRGLSDSIRMELLLDGLADQIKVCTVMPASIDTNMFQNAANFSGQRPRAVEPVHNPELVADQIVSLVDNPKREVIVGAAGKVMALQHATVPALYDKLMARFTRSNLLSQEPVNDTNGNLFDSLPQHSGVSGGWQEQRLRADHLNNLLVVGAALGAGILGAGYLLSKRIMRD